MPLIILTGLPCSGKSYRAQQIAAALKERIASDPSSSKRTVYIVPSHHASSDGACDPDKSPSPAGSESLLRDQIYNSAAAEKTARAEEFSAIKRAVSKDTIVIADGLNYIKGYRYQLWCEAKAVGTRCCVVHVAAQEDECKTWNRERLRAWGRAGDGTTNGNEDDLSGGMETQGPGKQGHNVLGDLVPESHTAIYGDRVVEHPASRSRSSSLDGDDGNRDTRPAAEDTMTLKSLYITDRAVGDGVSTRDRPSSSLPPRTAAPRPAAASSFSSTIPIPQPTSSPPYSPATLRSLAMRYEPPSPFSRWDTPLFTIPSSDATPQVEDIWTSLFPPASQRLSKKALSQRPAAASATASQITPDPTTGTTDETVKPHAATVLPQATSSDALQTLESATMDVVRHLLLHLNNNSSVSASDSDRSIPISIPLPTTPPSHINTTLHVPASAPPLTQPLLQRLRRKYTQMQRGGIAHGQGYVRGRRQVVEGFVAFLEQEWNEDDD